MLQAAENLGRLNDTELTQFQELLDMENPDLFKWLTGQQQVPDDVRVRPLPDLEPRSRPM